MTAGLMSACARGTLWRMKMPRKRFVRMAVLANARALAIRKERCSPSAAYESLTYRKCVSALLQVLSSLHDRTPPAEPMSDADLLFVFSAVLELREHLAHIRPSDAAVQGVPLAETTVARLQSLSDQYGSTVVTDVLSWKAATLIADMGTHWLAHHLQSDSGARWARTHEVPAAALQRSEIYSQQDAQA